ncbi:nucleoside deaminase, partial [Burkholderia multivorans]
MADFLEDVLTQAVAAALAHVESGGIPFVGVVVDGDRVISEFGVNRVHETGDPTAHAEIVAIRDALTA